MKTFSLLFVAALSLPAFASDQTLNQFVGEYELVSCKGKANNDLSDAIKVKVEYLGGDSLTVYEMREDDYRFGKSIESINGPKIKDSSSDEYACINNTTTSTFKGNTVVEHTRFVSYLNFNGCGKVPVFTGKIEYTMKNLGKGKLSINNYHTMVEDRKCVYKKI